MKHTKQPKPSGQECKYCNGMGKYEIAGCVYTCSCKQPPPPPSLPNRSEKEREKETPEKKWYWSLFDGDRDLFFKIKALLFQERTKGFFDGMIFSDEKHKKLIIPEIRHQYAEELIDGVNKLPKADNGPYDWVKRKDVLSLLERKGEK